MIEGDGTRVSPGEAGGRVRGRWSRVAVVATAAILLGVALRIVGYLSCWSLFIDDARLAIDIGDRSYIGLTRPLDFEQSAPLLLLWSDRLLTRLGGVNEYTLRAVPFVCGAGLLFLLWRAGRQLMGEREALLATAAAAGAPLLLQYSAYSVKQYGVDAFVTVGLLALTVPVIRDPTVSRAWRSLIIGGALAIVLSQPAVFVIAAVVAALALGTPVLTTAAGRARLLTAVLIWGTSFAVLYFGSYRFIAANPYMRRYWDAEFLTLRTPDWSTKAMAGIDRVLVTPFWLGHLGAPRRTAVIVVGLLVAGLVVTWRRRGRRAALLVGIPYALLFATAIAGRYPLAGRLGLFAIPLFLLAAATAVVAGLERVVPSQRLIDYALILIATVLVAVELPSRVERELYFGYEPVREEVHDYERLGAREPVYLFARGVPAWVFYSTDWSTPDLARLRWYADVVAATGPAFENAATRARTVHDEGDSLRYTYAGRQEIIGVGSGEQFGVRGGARVPDSGWAENEVRRLRAAARPFGWLFASHYFVTGPQSLDDTELGALLAEIRKSGGLLVCATVRQNAALYRVRFPDRDLPAGAATSPVRSDPCR